MLVLHDITLFVTLFHYDLPQDLQDQYDGWLGKGFDLEILEVTC